MSWWNALPAVMQFYILVLVACGLVYLWLFGPLKKLIFLASFRTIIPCRHERTCWAMHDKDGKYDVLQDHHRCLDCGYRWTSGVGAPGL